MFDNNQIGCRRCLFIEKDNDSIVKNILSLFGIIFVVFFGGMVFILGSILIILWHGVYDSIRIYKILKNKEKRKNV
jgi:hypothetical protein